MLAALCQHGTGIETPAPSNKGASSAADAAAALGGVPHMLRGQLTGFSQAHMSGCAHAACTACSRTVIEAYREQSWDLVSRVLQVRPCLLQRLPSAALAFCRTWLLPHLSSAALACFCACLLPRLPAAALAGLVCGCLCRGRYDMIIGLVCPQDHACNNFTNMCRP